jgi:aminoglycoside phosphotransferase (APT) family kinase protein
MMKISKEAIANYVKSLNPKDLGLKDKINLKSIDKFGQGTGNFNYLLSINDRKFVFRINAVTKNKNKSRKEYEGLKLIEKLGISPKAFILEENKNYVGSDFVILSYVEGETIDKTPIYFKDSMIKGLAQLLAKIHSVKITIEMKRKLSVNEHNSDTIFSKVINKYVKYIKNNTKNKELIDFIDTTIFRLKKDFKKISNAQNLVLSQGDFCSSNIIYHNGDYKIIDFENMHLTDPIVQIATILIDFGKPFNDNQKKLFLKEYLKIRKEKNLDERVNNYIPVLYFAIFLWAVEYALKVKHKEFHQDFLKDHDIAKDYEYVRTMFKRNLNYGVIDKKFNSFNIIKEAFS